jgi:SAM-dependent methyltransferase
MSDISYDPKLEWTKFYTAKNPKGKTYPNEHVVRIFMGSYPQLNLDKSLYQSQRICDLGCGDGRNLVLFHDLGFETHGVEITEDIVDFTNDRLKAVEGIDVTIRVGSNDNIPYQDNFFDYLLSWGACYYMGGQTDFQAYVKEFARVLRPGGYLILLIPKSTHFIFRDSVTLRHGYEVIQNDPVGIRNGEILRMFSDEKEIRTEFGEYFEDFTIGSQEDDCFGEDFHTYLVVCQRMKA